MCKANKTLDQDQTAELAEQLFEERRFLVLMLDNTPEAISYLDNSLIYRHCNAAAAEQLGRPLDRIIGHRLDEIVDSESPMYDAVQTVLRTGKPCASELKVTLPDRPELGEMVHLVSYIPDIDASGKVCGIFASGRDITTLKKTEEELRSMALFPSENPYPVIRVSGEGRVLYANRASAVLWDCCRCEIGGDVPDYILEVVIDALSSGVIREADITCNGSTYSFVFTPIVEASYVNMYGRDVTDRRQAEDALRESEERLRGLAEAMPQLVWTANADGTVDYYNSRAAHYHGFKRKPDGTWIWQPVLHPDDIDVTIETWQFAVSDQHVYQIEHRVRMADNSYRWHLSRAFPVRQHDGTIRWFGTATDIHDVKQTQEKQLERERHIAEVLQDTILAEPENDIPCCELAVRYQPALDEAHVGGDFYDVFKVGDNRYSVIIGDVAGKGLAAARRVAAARYALRNYSYLDLPPGKVVSLANDALNRETPEEAPMVTAFYAVVDANRGEVAYANAGHETVLFIRANGKIEELKSPGIPLGVVCGYEYQDSTRQLNSGDTLVMITDGITEARTDSSRYFGIDGVKRILAETRGAASETVAEKILEAAREFGEGILRDDAAIVVFRIQELGDW